METDRGPCYGVPLLDWLPIGSGTMRQALPSSSDLAFANDRVNSRVSGGYEVLLDHWRVSVAALEVAARTLEACINAEQMGISCDNAKVALDIMKKYLDLVKEARNA